MIFVAFAWDFGRLPLKLKVSVTGLGTPILNRSNGGRRAANFLPGAIETPLRPGQLVPADISPLE